MTSRRIVKKPKGPQLQKAQTPGFLKGGGELAKLIEEFDWSATSLGPIAKWPQNLQTAVNIILQSPVPIVMLWGKDGIMIYNDGYSVFAAGRHPSLLGSKVVEGWPEVADFNRNVMAQCFIKGKTLSYSSQQLTLYRNNKPETIWADLNYSPIMDEDGKPAGVMAIVAETTQRILAEQKQKKAEFALHAERERLHNLFMHAPAIIAVMRGPQHTYELANPLYMQIIGQRPLLGKTIRQALPELADQGVYEVYDQTYQSGKPSYGNEVPVKLDKTGDGTISQCYFNFVYQPYFNDEDKVEGVLVHAMDVTDQVVARKKIEEQNKALASSEERFRFMAETLPLKIFTTDPLGRITYFNPQWSEYTGVPIKRLLNERVLQFLHPDDIETSMDSWRQALENGEPLQNEQRLLRADGQYRRHISYVRPLRDDTGKVVSWFGSMTDIEDVLQAVIQKEKLELMAAGLREQRTQLLTINKAKDEFISLSSHQLRTPATAVKQYISMVLDGYFGPLNSQQLQSLKTAYDSNERQLNIISDLLKTAQLDSNSFTLNRQKRPIAAILTDTIEDLRSALELKKQTVVFIGQDELAEVLVDSGEIKLAFVNLLENAIKYSHPGTTISIHLQKTKNSLDVKISDQGVGIDDEDTKRIFDKFTRINNELSDTVNGTGLGLYWVKRIIKLHRGSIKVQSAVGVGTSFIVRLPAAS